MKITFLIVEYNIKNYIYLFILNIKYIIFILNINFLNYFYILFLYFFQ